MIDTKEQLHQRLKDIKTQLRLSMNGVVSQSMREKGLVYKLNFGVELPRIKGIAAGYEKDHSLAQALWKEDIRECKKLYPNWQYERLNDSNVEECFQMALKWRNKNGCEEDTEKNSEMCVTLNSLRLYKELDLCGGVLRAEGNVVAFSIGEPVSDDTFVVHIEKAFADVPGAYPMINQQFVEHEVQGFSYVNREEDMGEMGLRSAKESYHPIFMVEKGIVTEKGE